jgi:hypothetical protein
VTVTDAGRDARDRPPHVTGGGLAEELTRGEDSGWFDLIAYGLSAAVAAGLVLSTRIETHLAWAQIAGWVYLAATIICAALVVLRHRTGRAITLRVRIAVAIAVAVGATIAPTAVEISRRVDMGWGRHAQSEVIITEEAARELLDGNDPYVETYEDGPLSARPVGTTSHYAYFPGMWIYGLPSAVMGRSALTDARIWFAAGALVAFALAVRGWRGRLKLRAALPLFVLPTGALLIATGGDDLPVLALILLGASLALDRRFVGAGLALGLACATKQPSFLALAFIGVAVARSSGRVAALKMTGIAGAVAAAVILPLFVWDPSAFIEDAIKFPLGVGETGTAAGTPTLGSALLGIAGPLDSIVAIALVAAILAIGVWVLVVRPPENVGEGMSHLALFFAAGIVLAPAARIGYLVFPVDFALWATCLVEARCRARPHDVVTASR